MRDQADPAARDGIRIPSTKQLESLGCTWKVERACDQNTIRVGDHGCWKTEHLRNLGVTKISPAAVQVATDLRSHLANIVDNDTRDFVEEAIKCYELELHRSAIVMSWLAAVHVLHKHVVSKHLATFNTQAKRVDSRWKGAKTTDDLGRMKESDFLERLVALSIIGANVKKELTSSLDRRNGCGHPNSMKLGANTVAHHLEILLLNVFKVFQ